MYIRVVFQTHLRSDSVITDTKFVDGYAIFSLSADDSRGSLKYTKPVLLEISISIFMAHSFSICYNESVQ